jgi:hypothetical protein
LLRNRRDLTAEQLQRTRRLMDENVDDALVSGYEQVVDQLTLPDPDDRHVLAAAIHGRANVIVTVNLRDFPADLLAAYGIEAWHPDKLIRGLLHDRPEEVVAALRELHLDLKKPPIKMNELLASFRRTGLVQTVAELHRLMES